MTNTKTKEEYQSSTAPTRATKKENPSKNSAFLLSVSLAFLLGFPIHAFAFQLEVKGAEELQAFVVQLLGSLFFLFIVFLAVRYACKVVGIDFPSCILPKKIRQDRLGNTIATERHSFFAFIWFVVWSFFKYRFKAFYHLLILPVVYLVCKQARVMPILVVQDEARTLPLAQTLVVGTHSIGSNSADGLCVSVIHYMAHVDGVIVTQARLARRMWKTPKRRVAQICFFYHAQRPPVKL